MKKKVPRDISKDYGIMKILANEIDDGLISSFVEQSIKAFKKIKRTKLALLPKFKRNDTVMITSLEKRYREYEHWFAARSLTFEKLIYNKSYTTELEKDTVYHVLHSGVHSLYYNIMLYYIVDGCGYGFLVSEDGLKKLVRGKN